MRRRLLANKIDDIMTDLWISATYTNYSNYGGITEATFTSAALDSGTYSGYSSAYDFFKKYRIFGVNGRYVYTSNHDVNNFATTNDNYIAVFAFPRQTKNYSGGTYSYQSPTLRFYPDGSITMTAYNNGSEKTITIQ